MGVRPRPSGGGWSGTRNGEGAPGSGRHRACAAREDVPSRDDRDQIGPHALAAVADRGGVVLILWNMFSSRLAPTTAPVPAPQAAAPAPTPSAVTVSLPAKVYFDVGAAAVSAEGSQTIAAVADMIKKDNLKVAITGYTDKTGDVATNEELAKSRTASVRDALKAAGVAEANMEMKPPLLVEVGAGGSDVDARRVEINKQ